MNKKMIIITMLLAILMTTAACSNENQNAKNSEQNADQQNPVGSRQNADSQNTQTADTGRTETQNVKTFRMTGENFKFIMNEEENPTITVNKGDKVRIEFESTNGFHDFVLDEFDAATKQVRPGDGTTTIEFIANKTGTFEYYCSVGSHRAQGMFGTLIVE